MTAFVILSASEEELPSPDYKKRKIILRTYISYISTKEHGHGPCVKWGRQGQIASVTAQPPPRQENNGKELTGKTFVNFTLPVPCAVKNELLLLRKHMCGCLICLGNRLLSARLVAVQENNSVHQFIVQNVQLRSSVHRSSSYFVQSSVQKLSSVHIEYPVFSYK